MTNAFVVGVVYIKETDRQKEGNRNVNQRFTALV